MKKEPSEIKNSIESMEKNTAHKIKESEIKLTTDMKELHHDLIANMTKIMTPFTTWLTNQQNEKTEQERTKKLKLTNSTRGSAAQKAKA